jgi:hypothetical protein
MKLEDIPGPVINRLHVLPLELNKLCPKARTIRNYAYSRGQGVIDVTYAGLIFSINLDNCTEEELKAIYDMIYSV